MHWTTRELHPLLRWTLLVGGLATAWGVTYLLGGTRTAAPHLFYLPVVLAALWFRPRYAVLIAAVAGILAGPLMPLNVTDGTPQPLLNWGGRLLAFIAVNLLTSVFVDRQAELLRRESDLLHRERDLERHRGALLQIIAHEIRTPVSVLSGGIELIATGRSGRRTHELADAMQRSLKRLTDLATIVAATTELERRDPPLVTISLPQLLEAVVDEIDSSFDLSRLIVSGPDEYVAAVPAPDNLRLAVRLLTENALRFSEDDVELSLHPAKTSLTIRIDDTGPGIPDDVLTGEAPFTQGDASTTRPYQGTGLGIYTSRRLIERLGGRLELASNTPRGTRVSITVPLGRVAKIDQTREIVVDEPSRSSQDR